MESDGPPVFADDEPMSDLTEACSEKYPESEYTEAAEAGSAFEPEPSNGQPHPHDEQEGEGVEAGDGKNLMHVFIVIRYSQILFGSLIVTKVTFVTDLFYDDYVVMGTSVNDVKVLREGYQRFCDDSNTIIDSVTMGRGTINY